MINIYTFFNLNEMSEINLILPGGEQITVLENKIFRSNLIKNAINSGMKESKNKTFVMNNITKQTFSLLMELLSTPSNNINILTKILKYKVTLIDLFNLREAIFYYQIDSLYKTIDILVTKFITNSMYRLGRDDNLFNLLKSSIENQVKGSYLINSSIVSYNMMGRLEYVATSSFNSFIRYDHALNWVVRVIHRSINNRDPKDIILNNCAHLLEEKLTSREFIEALCEKKMITYEETIECNKLKSRISGTSLCKNNGGFLTHILSDIADPGDDYNYLDEIRITFVPSKSNLISEV